MTNRRILFILFCLALLLPSYAFAEAARVAVLPWKVNSAEKLDFLRNAMTEMLSTRLGSKASIEVVAADQVRSALKDDKVEDITDKAAADIAKKLKVDYIVYGSLTFLGSSVSLDAKMLNSKSGAVTPFYSQGTGMDSVIPMTEKLSADVAVVAGGGTLAVQHSPAVAAPLKQEEKTAPADKKGESDGFIIKPKEDLTKAVSFRSRSFEGLYLAMAVADLDKDGKKEVFLMSERNLVIANVKGDDLEVVKEIKSTSDNVAISAIDSDNDGSIELYVSSVHENKPATSIIEFKDNDYRVTAKDIKWLLRTVQAGKGEQALVGQKFRANDGLYGELRVLRKEGATVADKGAFDIKLPKKVNIYSFEINDITGSGSTELVAIDERQYVRIYRNASGKWEEPWKSKDYFDGTLNYIEFYEDKPGLSDRTPVAVKGRFFAADTNKDGKPELIIKRNVPGGLGRSAERPGSFTSGQIFSLSWDKKGEDLVENWKTREVKGYIADFVIGDLDNDKEDEVVMLIVEGTESMATPTKSYVLLHKFSI